MYNEVLDMAKGEYVTGGLKTETVVLPKEDIIVRLPL